MVFEGRWGGVGARRGGGALMHVAYVKHASGNSRGQVCACQHCFLVRFWMPLWPMGTMDRISVKREMGNRKHLGNMVDR